MNLTDKQVKRCKAESHRQQFNGRDYQQAAYDSLGLVGATVVGGPDVTEEQLAEIESSPDPGCDCGFCATAEWQDPCDRLGTNDRTPYVL